MNWEADGATPETEYALGERLRIVLGALGSLTEAQLEVVCLRFYAGYTAREIATAQGVSESAVSRMQRRAIERMRWALERRGIRSLGHV